MMAVRIVIMLNYTPLLWMHFQVNPFGLGLQIQRNMCLLMDNKLYAPRWAL